MNKVTSQCHKAVHITHPCMFWQCDIYVDPSCRNHTASWYVQEMFQNDIFNVVVFSLSCPRGSRLHTAQQLQCNVEVFCTFLVSSFLSSTCNFVCWWTQKDECGVCHSL